MVSTFYRHLLEINVMAKKLFQKVPEGDDEDVEPIFLYHQLIGSYRAGFCLKSRRAL